MRYRLFILVFLLCFGCTVDNKLNRVSFVGINTFIDYSTYQISSFETPTKNDSFTPLIMDKAFCVLSISDDDESFYLYETSDPLNIEFSMDACLLNVNKSPRTIKLTNSKECLDVLKNLTKEQVKSINLIVFDESLPASFYSALVEKFSSKKSLGLIGNPDSDVVPVQWGRLSLLPLTWVGLSEEDVKQFNIKDFPKLTHIQLIINNFTVSTFSDLFTNFKGMFDVAAQCKGKELESLISSCPNIRSLVSDGLTIDSLKYIRHTDKLLSVALNNEEINQQAIEILGKFSNLNSLSLNQLEFFSAPHLSEKFSSTINTNLKNLEMLFTNLSGKEELASLAKITSLSCLGIGELNKDNLSTIVKMKNIKSLYINNDNWEDSEESIEELKKFRPDLTINPTGICLGSFWLLLIFPLLWLSTMMRNRIGRS